MSFGLSSRNDGYSRAPCYINADLLPARPHGAARFAKTLAWRSFPGDRRASRAARATNYSTHATVDECAT
jgi:hypothetical protein